MPNRLVRLMIAGSALGAACGEPTAPASDLAGTWTYVDSMHFEFNPSDGLPTEVYNVRAGQVTLVATEPVTAERARFEGMGQETVRSGFRRLGSSGPFFRQNVGTFDRPVLVVALDHGVRGLVMVADVIPWTAVERRKIDHTIVGGGECAGVMPPRTACTQHILWTRLGP
jgi:hypothetical protein